MSDQFPIPLALYNNQEEAETRVCIVENKTNIISLPDDRKLHILLENPAAKKPAKKPLSEDQQRLRFFLGIMLFFFIMLICLIFTFFETI